MAAFTEARFLEELAQLTTKLRQEIEARARNLDPSREAIRARRARVLGGDFRFFAWTYFPHHVWGGLSRFQAHFVGRFPQLLQAPQPCREWWIAPRGESKSTLLTKIGPVYIHCLALLQDAGVRREVGWRGDPPPFLDYVMLLGAETSMPTKLLEVSKTELVVNPALALDWPEVVGATTKWKVGEYISQTGVKVEPKGAEQAVRGTFHGASRPKVLMGDDLITDKEAKSPTERDKRWDWLEKAIDYLGPPDGSVKWFCAATVLNPDDPVSRAKKTIGHRVHHFRAIEQFPARMDLWDRAEELMRNDDRRALEEADTRGQVLPDDHLPSYRYYRKNRKKMEAGAETSWPAVRSLYWLMRQRAKNRRAFATEMQGEPIDHEDLVFCPEGRAFWVSRLAHWIPFGACDPSMGKGESADPSALLVGLWDTHKKRLHVDHADMKRRVPTKLHADLMDAQREYGCGAWMFENNNAFEYMRQQFVALGIDEGVPLPLAPYTATVPAEVRIDSLEPEVCGLEPRILFRAELTRLLEELDTWPLPQAHHHYDGLVALHLLWVCATTRARGLPRVGTRRARGRTNLRGYDG